MDATPFGHHMHHHRGWIRSGRRGRWLEPFVLLLIAEGGAHGYALIQRLDALGVAADGVDVGMAYRTLREFEAAGLVESDWAASQGAPRREYRLSAAGREMLDDWADVMGERRRLIDEFLTRYGRLGTGAGG